MRGNFYASVRLDSRSIGALMTGRVVGKFHARKVGEDKGAPPFKVVELTSWYGEGSSKTRGDL